MALQKTKPTSPGRRFVVRVESAGLHKGEPLRRAAREQEQVAAAATTRAASRRATRAAATSSTTAWSISSATRTASRPRSSASSTTRTAARTSRWCCTPTASAATSSRPRACRWATRCMSGADAPIKPGNALPLRNIPVGTQVHCVEMKPGKGAPARAHRRHLGAARRARRRLRHAAPALRRDAQGPRRLPRHHRRGRQRRAQPAQARQGRRHALARRAPDGARRGHEPGRSSARWRRRPHRPGGRHPVSPWGTPTKGYKTRNNKRTDGHDRPPPEQEVGDSAVPRSVKKGPFVDAHLAKKVSVASATRTIGVRSRPGRVAR